jgi:hypothetical protein
MSSLIEELQRREAAARQEVDELRGEIAGLNERLARAGERLSRLEITRETVAEILGGADAERPTAGQGVEAATAAGPASAGSRLAGGSSAGVVTVRPWPSSPVHPEVGGAEDARSVMPGRSGVRAAARRRRDQLGWISGRCPSRR